jgi:prepilin-type N-terminal cleavage/methylation domain-containing protein
MNNLDRQLNSHGTHRYQGRARAAFTLIELLVCIVIIGIMMSISSMIFRKVMDAGVLAQAHNAVITYAKMARSYAMANNIETMMVVNPFNGRFEIWHLNPPPGGGTFDPLSGGTITPQVNGYAFAPVLDSSARLPLGAGGVPAVAVNPIDYDDPVYRPAGTSDPQERNLDNLAWAAFCFDPDGQLVIRTRRIATRTYTMRDGTPRTPDTTRNRLIDESPDLQLDMVSSPSDPNFFPLVTSNDSPITSTRGFVLSDFTRMRPALTGLAGTVPTPDELLNKWLRLTRDGQPFSSFALKVILNRYSGEEVLGTPK